MVWINGVILIFAVLMVIPTKYHVKLWKVNGFAVMLLHISWIAMPFWNQPRLWGNENLLPSFDNPDYFVLLMRIFALLVFVFGIIQAVKVIKVNSKATNGKNATPQILVTTGIYSKIRHPMYAMILLTVAGWFLFLGSIIGYAAGIIVSALFIIDTFIEEKRQLLPVFGEEYIQYRQQVKTRIFSRPILLILIACLTFVTICICSNYMMR